MTTTASETSSSTLNKTFEAHDFLNLWYPACFAAQLSSTSPTLVQIFERDLVLFKDADGTVRCLKDECPHRLAPLSTGRITTHGKSTVLECSYHGWQFDGSGTCVLLPQRDEGKKIISQYDAHAVPVQTHQGIVFVFLGDVKKAQEIAPPSVPELEQEGWIYEQDYMRDLPYDYTTLVENIIDPSHVPVSHHGTVQGNRELAQPLSTKIRSLATTPVGFEGVTEVPLHASTRLGFSQQKAVQRVLFAPSLLQYHFSVPAGDACALFYPVPTSRGHSRVLVRRGRNFATERKMGTAQLIAKHLENNVVFDQDMAFLRGQEARLQQAGNDGWGGAWRERYVMPAKSDRFVITFRKQLDAAAAALPWLSKPTLAQPLPRRVLLDRYGQHTRHCPTCSGALSTVEKLLKYSSYAQGLGAMATFACLAGSTPPALPFFIACTLGPLAFSASLLTTDVVGPVVGAVPTSVAAAPAIAAVLLTAVSAIVAAVAPAASRVLGCVLGSLLPLTTAICASKIARMLSTLRDRFIYTEEAKAIQDS